MMTQPGLPPEQKYTTYSDRIKQLESDLAAMRAERDAAILRAEAVIDSECDKVLKMTDEQVKALCAFTGHHPDDEAQLGRQAFQIAALRVRLDAALVDAERYRFRRHEGWLAKRFDGGFDEQTWKTCYDDFVDESIDAARKGGKEGG